MPRYAQLDGWLTPSCRPEGHGQSAACNDSEKIRMAVLLARAGKYGVGMEILNDVTMEKIAAWTDDVAASARRNERADEEG